MIERPYGEVLDEMDHEAKYRPFYTWAKAVEVAEQFKKSET